LVINRKRVQRVWCEEGLRVARKARKKRRLANPALDAARLRAEHRDHLWALEFQHDQTADGGRCGC
jgi:putative transposase